MNTGSILLTDLRWFSVLSELSFVSLSSIKIPVTYSLYMTGTH